MKTITLEEIYADPHVLEAILADGAPVDIVRVDKTVGKLFPTTTSGEPRPMEESGLPKFLPVTESVEPFVPKKLPSFDFRARFLEMWGSDAFKSTRSVEDIINYARRERDFRNNE